jgi:PIN domain nuclease of toxin-antitoxin system
MNCLLDTCAMFALATGALPRRAYQSLEKSPQIFVHIASLWELAIKHASGKLTLSHPPLEWYERLLAHHGLRELAIARPALVLATTLPPIHKDPFDRLIIATATLHQLVIITRDEKISQYPRIKTLW